MFKAHNREYGMMLAHPVIDVLYSAPTFIVINYHPRRRALSSCQLVQTDRRWKQVKSFQSGAQQRITNTNSTSNCRWSGVKANLRHRRRRIKAIGSFHKSEIKFSRLMLVCALSCLRLRHEVITKRKPPVGSRPYRLG
jgi:hypothetical protein